MNPPYYRVTNSRSVTEQLRAILRKLVSRGRRDEALRTIRWLYSELERTPSEFEESREGSDRKNLQMRIAFGEPLFVRFGVHEPSRTVFVSHFGILKK